MKTRNGFVSNSSSSSFILNFDGEVSYDKVKSLLSNYNFEDLDNSIKCFMKNLHLINKEELKDEINRCKKWNIDYDDEKELLELLKQYPKGLYEICISDHRDEDPWAIIDVNRDEDGDIADYNLLESEMSWVSPKEVVKIISGR